ncbi:hypothetical protein ACFPK5_20460 [Streptomyces beijiangensis]|uniref:hypothetical protein n=1 Tax=Streptomyces beijiangensis TaxID=163361 RepID=UPI00338687E3
MVIKLRPDGICARQRTGGRIMGVASDDDELTLRVMGGSARWATAACALGAVGTGVASYAGPDGLRFRTLLRWHRLT